MDINNVLLVNTYFRYTKSNIVIVFVTATLTIVAYHLR
ncbi:hypothetical protein GGQ79_004781 [Ochrobactrum pecoris]|uniref:Uncharacterized protein n=1 Tax=Brucella pecoris TaxID=867683 RepID=A0AB34YYU8_9HYPH|nr:hypothetical protein [Brucella pecoris]